MAERGAVSVPRVLIAEDDQAFRSLLEESIRGSGYEVLTVDNGVDLLDALGASLIPHWGGGLFDLVLSDMRMPGWTGLDVLASLGHSLALPPVVFITAFADDELRRRARQAGAVAVFDKPVDLDDLMAFVSRFLGQRPH